MTRGGADHVLECVGAGPAMDTAIRVTRPGGTIGYVGVPHGVAKEGLDILRLWRHNLTLVGGPAPVRAYMEELMEDVLAGTLDPSPVFDMTVGLRGVPDGYAAKDERRALKVMVRVQEAEGRGGYVLLGDVRHQSSMTRASIQSQTQTLQTLEHQAACRKREGTLIISFRLDSMKQAAPEIVRFLAPVRPRGV